MRFQSYYHLLYGAVISSTCVAAYNPVCDKPPPPNEVTPFQQPDSHNATQGPWRHLPWGEINFLHTTDTHGWLEGHLNEVNYGADWGDFVSFVTRMREKADRLNVDLLVVDTGDLVTGNGLSDSTKVPGRVSNDIFENVEFDLLTVGNNDLYSEDGTRDIHANFSRIYGDWFITSNVYIEVDGKNVTVGQPFRYFTTKRGLRVMAFGITLLDFKLDMKKARTYVHGYQDVVQEPWFQEALNKDVDLYVLLGHVDLRSGCAIHGKYGAKENPLICMEGYLERYLREHEKKIPIQVFGGHTHQRDFKCFDTRSSGLESGRYADTVGWLALKGVAPHGTWTGNKTLTGVPTPTRTCPAATSTSTSADLVLATETATAPAQYIDRRYLDFNRRTFAYHAIDATGPDVPAGFDTPLGRKVSDDIWKARADMNLTTKLGCVPKSYYLWVCPPGTDGNIYTLVKDALNLTVKKNQQHSAKIPRVIFMNNASIRYDLYQGPFTVGDALAVSPYDNTFSYIPNVPGKISLEVVDCLVPPSRGSGLDLHSTGNMQGELMMQQQQTLHARHALFGPNDPNPGHATNNDFGNCELLPDSDDCGDDTKHTQLQELYSNPTNIDYRDPGITDGTPAVDLVFITHLRDTVLKCDAVKGRYSDKDVVDYTDKDLTTRTFLQQYVKEKWGAGVASDCPIGK
ncbi:Ser/Thr protein phosphatase family protein [Aspergillus cavernicola]|uniref:Ser/Thr protein phosphatase family protein n=1 Tax=Aspergillus cavernicola TaxID=176166 RepID=A0ABR4HIW1_9EURO